MKTFTILVLIAWTALITFTVICDDVVVKNTELVFVFLAYAAYAITSISEKGSD
jgi:hypothetical protein